MIFRTAIGIFLLILSYSSIFAQSNPYSLQRINSPIKIDGQMDEDAWQSLPPFPLITFQPIYRADPSEKTVIRAGYDDNYLYFFGEFHDSSPTEIRANTMYRDRYSNDDVFHVILDTFNDNENALWFMITPNGVRIDATISNDATGNWMNTSWNGFWDAATVINEKGWFAEVRIPFSSLGFQDKGGDVVMGLIVNRYLARQNERVIFPDISPEWSSAQFKPSKAQDVLLQGIYSQKPVYITPYLLGGASQIAFETTDPSRFVTTTDVTQEIGLDLKYNINSNLTLDLTANTDFAQVEADEQQVNFTRFSLFFPEKRQFFQERSSLFDFNTGGPSRLFHSRRIGINENGTPVRILGGARLVGRLGAWDLGILDMQTDKKGSLDSENFGVLRLRRQAFNPYSYIGVIATNRITVNGDYNTAYGLDGIIKMYKDHYLTLRYSQSFESDQDTDFFDTARMLLLWEHRRNQGLNTRLGFTRSGPSYNPGMGFIRRNDFTLLEGDIFYGWFPGKASPFRIMRPGIVTETFLRNSDGTLESAFFGTPFRMELKSGAILFVGSRTWHEDLRESFSISDSVDVPVGSYTFWMPDFNISAPEGNLFRPSIFAAYGKFYDGTRGSLGLGVDWYPSRFLELGADYDIDWIRFSDRDQSLNVHLLGIRIRGALNTQFSVNAFMQYNSVREGHPLNTNLRIRYNFREGSDLYIVYNDDLNTDRGNFYPRRPASNNRAVLLKYTYTLIR